MHLRVVLAIVVMPSLARADESVLSLARHQVVLGVGRTSATPPVAEPTPLATLGSGVVVLALGAIAWAGGMMGQNTPPSVVTVACPSLAPPITEVVRPPMWSVPDGGKRPVLFATLMHLRF